MNAIAIATLFTSEESISDVRRRPHRADLRKARRRHARRTDEVRGPHAENAERERDVRAEPVARYFSIQTSPEFSRCCSRKFRDCSILVRVILKIMADFN